MIDRKGPSKKGHAVRHATARAADHRIISELDNRRFMSPDALSSERDTLVDEVTMLRCTAVSRRA